VIDMLQVNLYFPVQVLQKQMQCDRGTKGFSWEKNLPDFEEFGV
jgi:hypothetical protein